MTAINPTPEYINQLMHLVHPNTQLTSKGFVLHPLSQAELSNKLRCTRCNKRPKPRGFKDNDRCKGKDDKYKGSIGDDSQGRSDVSKGSTTTNKQDSNPEANKKDFSEKPRKPRCQWHSGTLKRNWTCCHGHMFAPGCQAADEHDMPPCVTKKTVERYQVHRTPPQQAKNPKAIAIAIDCEMGTSVDGNSELIRVTVLEYFTATPLLDTLVYPDVPMLHYNTRYSGITHNQMTAARRNRTCLFGVAAARRAIWQHTNAATIVVGHDVRNDFTALRWAHGVVVDSLLVEDGARKRKARDDQKEEEAARSRRAAVIVGGDATEAEYANGADGPNGVEDEAVVQTDGNVGEDGEKVVDKPKGPGLSLKAVSKLLLDRTIQKSTHDSMEDALASRDIVDYHVAGLKWMSCEQGSVEAA